MRLVRLSIEAPEEAPALLRRAGLHALAAPGRRAGLAASATAAATAAWTVREDADGTVSIYLRQYTNAAGLQQVLPADGVNAIVRSTTTVTTTVGKVTGAYPACTWRSEDGLGPVPAQAPPAVQEAAGANVGRYSPSQGVYLAVHTSAMPPGRPCSQGSRTAGRSRRALRTRTA